MITSNNVVTCAVEGCPRDRRIRGWCQMHWHRWRRHGDPGEAARRRVDRREPKIPKPKIWDLREDIPATELAWAAGLFEGEGTVRINKATARNKGHVIVSVCNTDLQIVDFFQVRWPGYMKRATGLRAEQKEAWVWIIAARRALIFLTQIEPYIVRDAVRDKIETARKFQNLKSLLPSKRPSDYDEQGFNLYQWMRVLNTRGVPDANRWSKRTSR